MRLLLVAALALAACARPDAAPAPPATSDAAPAPAAPAATVQSLAASDLAARMADPNVVVIDVRTPAEFGAGHVKGALNYDVTGSDFARQIATLDKGKTYVVYCRSGSRSARAGEQMIAAGFPTVFNAGGFSALQAAGVPAE